MENIVPRVPSNKATQLSARRIMRMNFFGVEESIKYLQANPTNLQLSLLSDIPFLEATLEEYKNSHVLVAFLPMSILEIRRAVKRELFHDHESAWYNRESFASNGGSAGWCLLRKTGLPNSRGKTWNEQIRLLAKGEEVPPACVVTYTVAGHLLATGEKLFNEAPVRCSDINSTGKHIYISYGSSDFHRRDENISLASAKTSLVPIFLKSFCSPLATFDNMRAEQQTIHS
jgi:hypothetical protein